MELLKQSQLELYHAKFALEKICRQNNLTQGDLYPEEFASPMESDLRQSSGNVFTLETGVGVSPADNTLQTNGADTAESVQVQLDPYDFMSIHNNPSASMMTRSPEFTIGRGGARGRRGGRGGRGLGPRRNRKRQEPEQVSSYNSQASKEGLPNLIKRFDSSLDMIKAKGNTSKRLKTVFRFLNFESLYNLQV